jgi:hypothetical protein
VLSEALRVLRPAGAVALGQRVSPPDGLDARMKSELSMILTDLGVDARRPGAGREETRQWLTAVVRQFEGVVAATWQATRTPRGFLDRHATGARFRTFPHSIREEALRCLAEWSVTTFGSLDVEFIESDMFCLDIYTI